jgi:HSP20 family protein
MANLIQRRFLPSRRGGERTMGPLLDEFFSPMGLRREIERVFDQFMSTGGETRVGGRGGFVPSVELCEGDNEYVIAAELPGMSDKDVQLEIDDDNVLTLKGEKKSEQTKKEGGYEYTERSYGQFMRSVQLPPSVDTSKVEAAFQNGVLEVHIPKAQESRAHAIPISTKGGGGEEAKAGGKADVKTTGEAGKKGSEGGQNPAK